MFSVCLLLAASISAFAQQDSVEVPENFPQIRFSMNPLYSSTGFYFGRILNVRRVWPILSSFEGELTMGLGTSSGPAFDRRCQRQFIASHRGGNQQEIDAEARERCTLEDNPWHFSFRRQRLFDEIARIKEGPVVIFYTRHFFIPKHILTQTNNIAFRAFAVTPNLKIEPYYHTRAWRKVHPDAGRITGRIVKASMEYPVRKTYEVIIQESENADNFRAMSVRDPGLFRYISRAMLTGKLLRIEYIRLWGAHARFSSAAFNFRTHYRVVSVELVDP